ncbi:hypothetical protein [Microvirga brassicacearum]|uniref:DUF2214 domain-containing protein n=1 Tax=Microvirga brassicacearum TaxID=2580413 RepID=A0A5N3P519_9HYPH|nr:hypothetical protein [Microvirga brassicacearum]KAB0264814.1 hypothetical protein FEZ63_21425 [Microvirga brassicacearum]
METFASLMRDYEQSGLGVAARSTTWLYPLANLIHVLGAALLVGAIAVFDIQVLRREGSLRALARATLPVAILGLVIQLVSGLILLSAEASTIVDNGAFRFKMLMLLLGLINVVVFHWRFGHFLQKEATPDMARPFAAISLGSWVLVLLAGRAIAYA